MAKPRTPILEIYALIGDEEQAVKKKREQRKEQGVSLQPSYPRPFGRLLRPKGIICEPICVTPPAHGHNSRIVHIV